jgi:hypothetical protein
LQNTPHLKGFVSKYGFLLGYSVFFIFLQIITFGLGEAAVTSPFGIFEVPVCTFGLILIDGFLLCAFQFISLFFNLFFISSSFAIVQTVFIVPFIIVLALIIADLLRGSG